MCYFFAQLQAVKKLENRFNAFLQSDEELFEQTDYNGFAHPFTPIISNENPKIIEFAQWGLVPWFAKEDPNAFWKKTNTLNAKIEGIEKKKSFSSSIDNRCLIVASEFYEWKHVGKEKIKHRIYTKDGNPFAFAGIYNPIGDIKTYTILTTEANELMAEIHNSKKRMPVVLRKEEEQLWLKGEPMEIYHERKEVELIAQPLDNLPLSLF